MEATSTLADALLDDLDDLDDLEETHEEEEKEEEGKANGRTTEEEVTTSSDEVVVKTETLSSESSRLLVDTSLQRHLKAIRNSKPTLPSSSKEEREEEHQMIVQSNKHLARLSDELAKAHGELCQAYEPKFPELEELLPNPRQYVKAVRVIGNEIDLTKVNEPLNEFLSSNQVITISVAGSTTAGRPLTEDELQRVERAAAYVEEIGAVQNELIQFVESRMEGLAPSVCALVGPGVAARLLGLAGGLAELSKIPACNLQLLGQVRQSSASRAGLSSAATKPHQGVLRECDLVQRCPKQMQTKALKLVAGKLALVARCDFVNVDTGRPRSAAAGLKFRHEIEAKFVKLQEPDKAPVLKALPK
jgi:U4/U6 small nuclear ribonucleoprotein PRP31